MVQHATCPRPETFESTSQWAKYRNPAVDAALQKGRATLEAGPRIAAYREVLTALHQDIPVVPLYQDAVMFVARKPVQFRPTASASFFLFTMG